MKGVKTNNVNFNAMAEKVFIMIYMYIITVSDIRITEDKID